MPVVTPFGELTLGDDKALDRWLQAHLIRHAQYVKQHIGPPGGILDGPVDGDWMLRHAQRHVALATVTGDPLDNAGTKVLALPHEWATEAELQDWHALHNRLHSHIDAIHGVGTGIKAPAGRPPVNDRPPHYGPGPIP
jgi:hypothetical protein